MVLMLTGDHKENFGTCGNLTPVGAARPFVFNHIITKRDNIGKQTSVV